jgi:RNA polymerase sigma-70 factor (ECF subfamily)
MSGGPSIVRSAPSPDVDLLARCAGRASGAWEEFLARYRGVMEHAARATLQRVIGSVPEDDLEAVVESTLLGLVKDDHASLRSFSGRSSLAGYLQAITAKVALNHLRSERRKGWLRFRPLDAASDAPAGEPPEGDPELLASLRRAMEKLAPRDRLILKLFHLDGAGYREIASLLGVSMNAVSPALIRARDRLRALMERDR